MAIFPTETVGGGCALAMGITHHGPWTNRFRPLSRVFLVAIHGEKKWGGDLNYILTNWGPPSAKY